MCVCASPAELYATWPVRPPPPSEAVPSVRASGVGPAKCLNLLPSARRINNGMYRGISGIRWYPTNAYAPDRGSYARCAHTYVTHGRIGVPNRCLLPAKPLGCKSQSRRKDETFDYRAREIRTDPDRSESIVCIRIDNYYFFLKCTCQVQQ